MYKHDIVDDFTTPIVVKQYTWTGDLYEVPTGRLLEMVAQSVMYDTSLPRMLNCIVPRAVLNAIQERFGNIFSGSLASDWTFCFRALEITDSILFHDKAALIHYGQNRSTGQSVHHGIPNDALTDFMRDLTTLPLNFAAPYPEIVTVWNAIISEYCHARALTQSSKFPELDLENYRRALTWGINQIKNPQRQKQMRQLLSARCQNLTPISAKPTSSPRPISVATAAPGPFFEKQASVEKFGVNTIEFPTSRKALDYALKYPRERAATSTHQALIGGIAVYSGLTDKRPG